MRASVLSCPPGFDFHATAAVLRRGPADPLIWFDGRRWRRRLAVDGTAFLVEVAAGRAGLLSEPEVRELAAPWTPYGGLIAFRLLLAHRQAVG